MLGMLDLTRAFLIFVLAAFTATGSPTGSVYQKCGNTPTTRQSWCDGFDINTNWYEQWPDTGVVREYWITVDNVTIAPDGVQVQAITFNGSLPGPNLSANWGDWFLVHVTNNLEVNGTAIHWHGMRQWQSNQYDGTPGVTQCPQAPGTTQTFKFQATQYGTSWYHSHFTVQFGAGLGGTIIINGPATMNYDEDLGAMTIEDWFHGPLSVFGVLVGQEDASSVVIPPASGALINGTNVFPWCDPKTQICTGTGKRWETTVVKGKYYRLRLINISTQTYYRFTIDNHRFWIIANDLVPVRPYDTDSLIIGEGQRFDIVFAANQAVGNYWLRAMFQYQKGNFPMTHENNTLGIIRYEGSATIADPTTENYLMNSTFATHSNGPGWFDVLEPWVALEVGPPSREKVINVHSDPHELMWLINGTSFLSDWEDPTVKELAAGDNLTYSTNFNYTNYKTQNNLPGWHLPVTYNGTLPQAEDIFSIEGKDEWVYFYINNYSEAPQNHPMHLHGHDFWILSQGTGFWFPNNGTVKTSNPPRRDVATLFNFGHLVIAFKSDNPGIWLLHCHIAWHVSQGLSWQYLERRDEILSTYNMTLVNDVCDSWDDWIHTQNGSVWGEDDSGD